MVALLILSTSAVIIHTSLLLVLVVLLVMLIEFDIVATTADNVVVEDSYDVSNVTHSAVNIKYFIHITKTYQIQSME